MSTTQSQITVKSLMYQYKNSKLTLSLLENWIDRRTHRTGLNALKSYDFWGDMAAMFTGIYALSMMAGWIAIHFGLLSHVAYSKYLLISPAAYIIIIGFVCWRKWAAHEVLVRLTNELHQFCECIGQDWSKICLYSEQDIQWIADRELWRLRSDDVKKFEPTWEVCVRFLRYLPNPQYYECRRGLTIIC